MENPIKDIDWEMLREQKNMLLDIYDSTNSKKTKDLVLGIIYLFDNIQDYAVDVLNIDESKVFVEDESNN